MISSLWVAVFIAGFYYSIEDNEKLKLIAFWSIWPLWMVIYLFLLLIALVAFVFNGIRRFRRVP